MKEFLHFIHSFFLSIDPPLKFFAGLAGTAVAIPIPVISDAYGNLVKQGIQMAFGDHEFDYGDYYQDLITGAGMGLGTYAIKKKISSLSLKNLKILKKVSKAAHKIRGASKSLVFFLFLFFFF